jgi:Tfp pilus assembly protein PilO
MAKKLRFQCPYCSEQISSGPGLGKHKQEQHPAEWLKEQEAKASKGGKRTAKPSQLWQQSASAADLMQQAVDKLGSEIDAKREQLASVDKLKAEIKELEQQREALKKLLPPV